MIRKFINIISVENKRLLLRFLAMIFFVTACIQKFDYEPKRIDENILVVSGGITNQPVVQTIMLSRTTPYGTGTYTSEPGAMIVIIENRKAIDTCIEVRDGIYQFDGAKIQPKPGNRYAIEITTREKKVYESDQETMPEPVKPDSAYLAVHIDRIPSESGTYIFKPSLNLFIDTPVRTASGPAYLRWQVIEDYSFREIRTGPQDIPKTCYMRVNPVNNQEIELFSGADLKGGILKGKLVLSRPTGPNYEFINTHYFLISQYSLSASTFSYWTKLKQVANPTGSFLEPPPGAVIGNVHNVINKKEIVLGYFEVASQEYAILSTVKSDLAPLLIRDPCTDNLPQYCFDCLLLPNSSLERPSYWSPY